MNSLESTYQQMMMEHDRLQTMAKLVANSAKVLRFALDTYASPNEMVVMDLQSDKLAQSVETFLATAPTALPETEVPTLVLPEAIAPAIIVKDVTETESESVEDFHARIDRVKANCAKISGPLGNSAAKTEAPPLEEKRAKTWKDGKTPEQIAASMKKMVATRRANKAVKAATEANPKAVAKTKAPAVVPSVVSPQNLEAPVAEAPVAEAPAVETPAPQSLAPETKVEAVQMPGDDLFPEEKPKKTFGEARFSDDYAKRPGKNYAEKMQNSKF